MARRPRRKIAYDYYCVQLDPDLSTDPTTRGHIAILAAKDQALIFALPCIWTVLSDDGATVTVRRLRLATPTA